jgi:deoxyribodipyrimidine photo-lyase
MTKIKSIVTIFWFRRDLRLEDNAGLHLAFESGLPVLPVFIFDTDILSRLEDKKDRRVDFVHQVLAGMQTQLECLGSTLCVKKGKVTEVFQQLTNEYDVKAVYCNSDYESTALQRDNKVKEYLQTKGIEFYTFKDRVIFEAGEILKANGEPYTVFTPYSKVWKQKLSDKDYHSYPSANSLFNLFHQNKLSVPGLEEIGFQKTDVIYTRPTPNESIISGYTKTRNFPSIDGTSRMSVHLCFGTISIRKLVALALNLNEEWLNELIWREFFVSISVHFPKIEKEAFKKKYECIGWRNNEAEFTAWCEGRTGYPLVDAGIRQLNETGWMHNRVRMIVAGFLTKHLLIDWRWGEAYFANKLTDYELSSNNGNWQWAAGCGCDAAPYFRIFNPVEQTKRFDPEKNYIRQWVKDLDTPDYPQPIVEHTFARNRALEAYKKIFSKQ